MSQLITLTHFIAQRDIDLDMLSLVGVSCGIVVTGTGAIVTDQTGDSYEATATIHCRRGYHRVTGSQLRTCIGDGTWSGTTLVCAGA